MALDLLWGFFAQSGTSPFAWVATVLAGIVLTRYAFDAFNWKKRVPGPLLNVPIFGDTIELSVTDPARLLFKRYKRYGRVFRLSLLGFDACVVSEPELLRGLMSDDGGHFDVPVATFKVLMGDYHLRYMTQKEHHSAWRKAMNVVLQGKGLQGLLPGLLAIADRNIAEWSATGRLDLLSASRKLALDYGVELLCGFDLEGRVDVPWLKEQTLEYLLGMYGLPLMLPGSQAARARAAMKRILAALAPVLKKEHEEFAEEWEAAGRSAPALAAKYAQTGDVTVGRATMMAFFASGDDTLYDTTMTVLHALTATVDTTKVAIFNTLSLVAMSPRVQEQLLEEQKRVMAEFGPELSYEALSKMPYAEGTFKECMRLLPASGGGFRVTTREHRVGDVVLSPGSIVWFHPTMSSLIDPVVWDGDTSVDLPAHMDWRNKFEGAFRPERWLSEATKPKYYQVFGSGLHQCLGMSVVNMEFKLLLSRLLRRYSLQLEVPDMLQRCTSFFPAITPVKGTDGLKLVPREHPLE